MSKRSASYVQILKHWHISRRAKSITLCTLWAGRHYKLEVCGKASLPECMFEILQVLCLCAVMSEHSRAFVRVYVKHCLTSENL